MLDGVFTRRRGLVALAATGAAYPGVALAEAPADDAYSLLFATLGEVPVTVFVAPQGTAAAVELSDRGAQVLTGLAAGAVLSEVEEAGPAGTAERTSPADAAWRIESMDVLSDDQKARLRRALSL